ncbi:septum site-determining protein MinC [Inhella gelatinilytica]|uniref:Probable septum site-determining protein MinC n=1 Tax=Inhella gelatinilytica TaxID=2795030 RepID=A0A931NG49_9BURK|nr:septum site-determining protein MinC [Inhella gelatinilytica]MBH9554226.1 septum site-determining protein MinC [Inhella gelatinilytica]
MTAARLELKSTQLSALQLAVRSRSVAELVAQMREQWAAVAGAFDGEALCLDVSELPPGAGMDWSGLVEALRQWQLRPVAVSGFQHLAPDEVARLSALGLALSDGALTASSEAAIPAPAPAAPPLAAPAPSPAGKPALIVDRPLRSGQQVYARDADLIVLGLVSHGAEVLADGHIHVYGALRGRAIAGARGFTEARIFAHCLEAELLAIAGTFRTAEKPLPPEVLAKPAQVRLEGDKLLMEPLRF